MFQLAVAKIMEQGPVLIMTFVAQQTMVVKDTRGNIVEGKEVGILRFRRFTLCESYWVLFEEV